MAFLPVIGGLFGGGSSFLGTALSAGSAIVGGLSAAAASRYQAAVADTNAKIATENAKRAEVAAQKEAFQQDELTLAFLGEQQAIQSASGLSGRSQLLTRKRAAQLGRQDTLNIRDAGRFETQNYLQQAEGERASAGMHRSAASNSLLQGFMGGVSSFIDGRTTTRTVNRIQPRDPWRGLRSVR